MALTVEKGFIFTKIIFFGKLVGIYQLMFLIILFLTINTDGLIFREKIKFEDTATLCEKRPNRDFFSGPYFPVFRLNMEIYEVNLRIQPE